MERVANYVQQVPQSVKVSSDVGVWLIAITGWLGVLQPWLTALATLLAITWTCIQIYSWIRRK